MLLRRTLSIYRVFDFNAPSVCARSFFSRTPVTVGIRREDPKRSWERRAPLTPKGVKKLVEGGVNVEVEHCDRRIFKDEEYVAAGASLARTLHNSHIILGIKEPPLAGILSSGVLAPLNSSWANRGYVMIPRTYLMFSHTVKGQAYNLPLLAEFVVQKESTKYAELIPRLIDYEMLTDESGKRTVGFGWFAGVAGVLESFSSMAQSHLENGIATPFLSTPRPHTHPTLQSLRQALRAIGDQIAEGAIPPALGPFVIGLTGNGNVAHGCLDILQELPIEKVEIKDLHALVTNPDTPLNKIYLAHAMPQDYFIRLDGQRYDRAHYYAYPQSYRSTFHETIAPYLTLFLNSTGWSSNFPRLMTTMQLSVALDRARAFKGFRFTNIGDISCDIEGGLQFLTQSTTLTAPFYKITPSPLPSVSLPQVQMMAVDILPATLPLDASVSFERAVLPFVQRIAEGYMMAEGVGGFLGDEIWGGLQGGEEGQDSGRGRELDEALERATIARRGELVGRYRSLGRGLINFWKREKRMDMKSQILRKAEDESWDDDDCAVADETQSGNKDGVLGLVGKNENEMKNETYEESICAPKLDSLHGRGKLVPEKRTLKSTGEMRMGKKKKVLMLGSGMVARPAVEVIARRGDVQLVVVSNSLVELERLSEEFLNIQYRVLDVGDWEAVEALIGESDVVVSLLPVPFHIRVARRCLRDRKHLVTASYVTTEMSLLHDEAVDKDVLLLNEIGLDPGIDHLTALNLISRLQSDRKIVQSFTSFCGGLPAPDVEHTPLRYKFSWNPRGVLQATLASAKFLLKDEIHSIREGEVLKNENVFPDVPITDEFKLEGLANRSSLAYREAYRLTSNQTRTLMRGTLRYPGFSSLMDSFRSLGFLNAQGLIYLPNWHSFVRLCIARRLGLKAEAAASLPPDAITRLVPLENIQDLHSALEWLGLVPTPHAAYTKPLPLLPSGAMVPIDIFAYLLAHQLAYKPHERDMVVLSHEIIAKDPHTAQEHVYTSSLIEYGTDRSSAMARTVGMPVGIAALLVLDGKIQLRGVVRPFHESVYEPMLSGLEELGLSMKETVRLSRDVERTVESALEEAGERKIKDGLEESVSECAEGSWGA